MSFSKRRVFLCLTLGLLTAFGPFVTDFYLPAMPSMAADLKTSPQLVSLSITMGMIGLALGQLLVGPLSDKYGRRGPLLASLAIFIVASLACLFAPDIQTLNVLRVFQGLGGAGASSSARACPPICIQVRSLRSLWRCWRPLMALRPSRPPS